MHQKLNSYFLEEEEDRKREMKEERESERKKDVDSFDPWLKLCCSTVSQHLPRDGSGRAPQQTTIRPVPLH